MVGTSGEGRVPPHDLNAEGAVLGAILLRPTSIESVESILKFDDFFVEGYRRIYVAMLGLHHAGVEIDAVTLGSTLRDSGELEKVGGAKVLADLTERCASAANVEAYAELVRKASALRKVIYAAESVMVAGYQDFDVMEKVEALRGTCENVTRGKPPTSLFELGQNVLDEYAKVASGLTGIEFPWQSMTNMTMGMWPKTITFFIARPGTGKSEIAVLCGAHAWHSGRATGKNTRVLIVSPEMAKEEIAERFFVGEAKVSYNQVVRGALSSFEYPKLKSTVDALRGENGIFIMDSEDGLSPENIDAKIKLLKPDLVAMDAIYELPFKGDDTERVAAALTWMRRSCKQYDYANVAFSQFNRKQEEAAKKGGGSRLGTIALSDKIGWIAHSVFALEQDKDMKSDKRLKLVPLKLRRGQHAGDGVEIRWDFDNMAFGEIVAPATPGYSDADDSVPF